MTSLLLPTRLLFPLLLVAAIPSYAQASGTCEAVTEAAIDSLDNGLSQVANDLSRQFHRTAAAIVVGEYVHVSVPGGRSVAIFNKYKLTDDCSVKVSGALWGGVAKSEILVAGLTEANVAEKLEEIALLWEHDFRAQIELAARAREMSLSLTDTNPSPSLTPKLGDGFGAAAGVGRHSYGTIWMQLPARVKSPIQYSEDGTHESQERWLQIQFTAGSSTGSSRNTTATQASVAIYEKRKIKSYGRGATESGANGPEYKFFLYRLATVSGGLRWDSDQDDRKFSKMFSMDAVQVVLGNSFLVGSARVDATLELDAGAQYRNTLRYATNFLGRVQVQLQNGFFFDFEMGERQELSGDKQRDNPTVGHMAFGAGRKMRDGWIARAGVTLTDIRASEESELANCRTCPAAFEGVVLQPEGMSGGLMVFRRF